MTWKPITCAPQDREILLFARGNRDFFGVGQWATAGELPGTIDGWFWPYAIRPTHWVPLPEAPNTAMTTQTVSQRG